MRRVCAALAAVMVLSGCELEEAPVSAPSATASVVTTSATPARMTAEQMVERLGELYPLPDPADNTGFCAAETGGCLQLITTDRVSVYEFDTPQVARRWVQRMRRGGQDWRQAGRFALAWTSRDQALTSAEARREMTAAARAVSD